MKRAPDALGKEVKRPQETQISSMSLISVLSGDLLAQIFHGYRLAEPH